MTISELDHHSLTETIEDLAAGKTKLELLTGLVGIKAIKTHQKMSDKNREAEAAAVRKAAFGASGEEGSVDDMIETTVLGNVVTHQHATPQKKSAGGMKTALLGALIGAAVPGAGVAGFLLNQAAPIVEEVIEAGEAKIGLGKIEGFNNLPDTDRLKVEL